MFGITAKYFWPLLVAVTALALALRLPELDKRPLHTDEAVNAYICGQLLEGEGYKYDPQDRHGPALHFSALPFLRFSGVTSLVTMDERSLRLTVAVLSGFACIFFACMRRPLGETDALIAALLWAAMPLPLFYGRYMIHETGFVIATLGLVATGWRAIERRSLVWSAIAGLFAALMLAFKETAVINFAAIGAAFLTFILTTHHAQIPPRTWIKMSAAALAIFAGSMLVIFTWGFTDLDGPRNLINAFVRFSGRAGGEGHEKPFWYFGKLLAGGWGRTGGDWSGKIFLLLAAIGSVRAWHAGGIRRSVIVWAVVVFLFHSFIPYKTPWLALNIWLPLALLAACCWPRADETGVHKHVIAARIPAILLFAALVWFTVKDDAKWIYRRPADENNPYTYSQTLEDVTRIEAFIRKHIGDQPDIAVVAKDPWPFPWYLRRFINVGYWQPDAPPTNSATVIITEAEAPQAMQKQLDGLRPEIFGVRPNVLFILWRKDVPK